MQEVRRQFTAARMTAGGRGAVASIRVCASTPHADLQTPPSPLPGLESLFLAANGLAIGEQPLKRLIFGQWGQTDREDLVICRPDSDVVEIHCHGGEAAVQRVLADLSKVGFTIVDWREQVLIGQGLIAAECQDVLSRTSTWRTTRIALEQANGLLKNAFLKLNVLITGAQSAFDQQLDDLLRWADFGMRLSTPWDVVLTGRPNVGKSSLINALLGYHRAIVFDQPGTTRDVVTGETAFDGWPVILSDTAGIRANCEGLEAAGISLARKRLQTADVRLLLLDLSEPPTVDDEVLLQEWPDALVVGHKADLHDRWQNRLPDRAIRVASTTGLGIVQLQQALIERLVPNVPMTGTPIPVTQRQVNCLKRIQQAQSRLERHLAIQELLDTKDGSNASPNQIIEFDEISMT